MKRKEPCITGHVPKRVIKLRGSRHAVEYVSESSCPNENEVHDAAAPVSILIPDELKSLSPVRLRPRLRPKN